MLQLSEQLLRTPVDEIAKMPCVSKGREDVLAGGAVWLVTIMKHLGIDCITISDCDNLEGYAQKKGLL
jgi:exopolyphosphatase/pppGpp-phosphohydrolase